mmetsp:Transcript_53228/g.113094  ORF Transcript_53228/g.113094 Transcript_53228/m.113094 type:complete len:232 (+) Transcript_53228:56-751(+)|eukprot:CAMPEP_0172551538 /NCGR_PEP_ID=MMETSP1067-20121228/40062_1 /TAXON_ID=265564 ORGANISM="Thalassiosira punctigera, Strain Tpunct2005C2" /NCGR_SAMPLE_ID=MMETSP1067 /ASSEMBLY_ACC=CAM_ASM_000444 /LENGTH=231 /DNA_ID=CAMNT_0013339343 /DNA_START=56 /DNA_END=751 /DNA_ORIENTATION=-
MSTSNQQQRGGRRQPFGFLHANTLSSAKGKGCPGTNAGNGGGGGAAAAHSSDPVKNESKTKFRGVLTSIVSRSKGTKNQRNSGSSSSESEEDVSMSESPTKKSRVTKEEDPKANTGVASNTAASECTRRGLSCHNEFGAGGVAGTFRQRPAAEDTVGGFWDDELEDMLELKLANPILNDSVDDQEESVEKERIDLSKSLAAELDENVSGEHLLWSNRLREEKNGFKIHIDE